MRTTLRPLAVLGLCAAVVLGAQSAPAPAATATTYAVPATIDPTGATDVTAKLKRFVAGVPDWSTIVFRAGARYRIENVLAVRNRHGLTFEGNGATFFATTDGSAQPCPAGLDLGCGSWPRRRSHWLIHSGSQITVRDVVVRGANPKAGADHDEAYRPRYEAQAGFDLQGPRGVLLERVQVYDVYGDFVYLGRDVGVRGKEGWSRDVTIRNSRMERNGRQGITPHECQDVLIAGNYIGDTRRSTFDLEPGSPSAGCQRLTIADNDIGRGRLNFVAAAGEGPQLEDIEIVRNRLHGKVLNIMIAARDGARRRSWRIEGNRSDRAFGSPLAAITMKRVDDVVVRGNHVPISTSHTHSRNAVEISNSTAVAVTDNAFPGARRVLVADAASSGYTESGNLLT